MGKCTKEDNIIVWLDLETTGLNHWEHGIVQLGAIIEVNGEEVATFSENINPGEYCLYDSEALKIHGLSLEKIQTFKPQAQAFNEFIEVLSGYVDKYDKTVKASIAGYNVTFDIGFIKAWFKGNGAGQNKVYFGSFFNHHEIDTFALVKILDAAGIREKNSSKKLNVICEAEGIDLTNAHNALADIQATRELHLHLLDKYIKR